MSKKQIDDIIEKLRQVYIDDMKYGLSASGREILKEILYWEKRLNNLDYNSE